MNTLTNVKKSQGIMMFIILLLSYIVFASNWVAGSNLSEKIVYHYFNGEQVSPMVSEVINYTITIARIFANLVAAYILLKLNPRKASIVALVLLCFSFVAVFATNYWLYTIARMIMALGGCGMNNTAKGGLIGAGSGAALGALVGGVVGHGKGAAIGAAVGAAVGTGAGVLIGKKMDKAAAQAEQIEGAQVKKRQKFLRVTFR